MIVRHDLESPVGQLILLAETTPAASQVSAGPPALRALLYPGHRGEDIAGDAPRDPGPFAEVIAQLEKYFAGERREFTVPIDPQGTPFQLAAWAQLRRIGYGETRSYGEVAAALGQPGAARAVGLANNRNPISIIVPCHRVIGAGGALTGYGGGMPAKQFLLDLESRERALF